MRKLIPCLAVLGLALVLTTAAGADRKEAVPKLYVTNSAGDNIHIIDLGSFKVIGEIRTGEHPHGAAVSADGRRFFTTVEGDQTLLVIDSASDRILQSIKLSGLPNQCAVTPDGKFVGVPIRGGDSVDIVDVTAGRIVKNLPVKAPPSSHRSATPRSPGKDTCPSASQASCRCEPRVRRAATPPESDRAARGERS